jgi:mRNA-degrading endonuclease RelE of RelBE toxin-antitoxin system
MKPSLPCTVVTHHGFLKEAARYWDEKEHDDFVNYIAENPTAGDEIQGTGGLRKVRWSRPGIGKRGGVRVIYYYHNIDHPLHLLWLYGKSVQDTLSPDKQKILAKVVDTIKKTQKGTIP